MRYVVLGLLLLGGWIAGAGVASEAGAGRPTFYLALAPGQCVISPKGGAKTLPVVPCSDPRHNLEVYAIRHGGWDHRTPPPHSVEFSMVQRLCLAAYQRITGHPLGTSQGWYGYWPDPGSEQARYGDKVICSFGHYPGLRPLGSGRHIR